MGELKVIHGLFLLCRVLLLFFLSIYLSPIYIKQGLNHYWTVSPQKKDKLKYGHCGNFFIVKKFDLFYSCLVLVNSYVIWIYVFFLIFVCFCFRELLFCNVKIFRINIMKYVSNNKLLDISCKCLKVKLVFVKLGLNR